MSDESIYPRKAESEEQKLSIVKRGLNAVLKAIADKIIVEERLDKSNPDDLAIIEMRKLACRGDESNGIPSCKFRDKPADMCKVCGCFLDLKIESRTNRNKVGEVVITHCPKGFWNDEEIANFYNSDKKT